jgi:hypothetical protein
MMMPTAIPIRRFDCNAFSRLRIVSRLVVWLADYRPQRTRIRADQKREQDGPVVEGADLLPVDVQAGDHPRRVGAGAGLPMDADTDGRCRDGVVVPVKVGAALGVAEHKECGHHVAKPAVVGHRSGGVAIVRLSGWYRRTRARYAWSIRAWVASRGTPRTAYGSTESCPVMVVSPVQVQWSRPSRDGRDHSDRVTRLGFPAAS